MVEHLLVIVTTKDRKEAEAISQLSVEKRLAGCAQVLGPITSTYRWKGKIEKGEEWLCLLKSQSELYESLESAIQAVHSYETPEILALPITKGSKSYLNWLESGLKKRK